MPDDVEEGPDPNDLRRHAKRMYTEMQYRKKYRRIDFYKPNRKQLEFHALNVSEKALFAGNQQGKTHGAGFEVASHATAIYPEWWTGRRFIKPPDIERPMEWLGWVSCTTSTMVRDNAQIKLFGPILEDGGLGTGLIPLDNIVGRPIMATRPSGFIDTATIRRETGGTARIQQKTYEMKREGYQGSPVDLIWNDEDVSRDDDSIYGEHLARTITTRGMIICSLSPMLGNSPLLRRFKERNGKGCAQVIMTIDDCLVSNGGHIPDEDLPELLAKWPENERATRLYGIPMQGEGAVFTTPIEQIKERLDPAEIPEYWRWIWGIDFRHSGSATTGHPFAAVLCAHDADTDTIHVVHSVRMLGLAPMHVAAMKQHPMWEAPVAWPHDGGRGGSLLDGETVAQTYKKLGLHMLGTHATFERGGFNFEAGIDAMSLRFATNKLKVASHRTEFFDEYMGYHRKDNLVVKVDDDLLSATRQAVMQIRSAKPPREFRGYTQRFRRPGDDGPIAKGLDFDLFTGG